MRCLHARARVRERVCVYVDVVDVHMILNTILTFAFRHVQKADMYSLGCTVLELALDKPLESYAKR